MVTLPSACCHEERVVGSCHSFMMVYVKPVDDNQASTFVLEEQDVLLHIARYAVAVSR
jgi:hypothetical protein